MTRNPYLRLGLVLALSGAVSAPILYFVVASVALTALAISTIILGLVSAMLGNARPDISPEASQMMLRTGMENIAALLEELGLRTRAVYLPSSADSDRPRAIIPLSEDGPLPGTGQVVTGRLIARYGPNQEDMCLVVSSPGAVSLDSVAMVQESGPDQIESVLNQILVGIMDLADSVSVHVLADRITVEVAKPKLKYENIWFYRCLGSPLATIAATVVSQALNQPVRVGNEEETKRGARIEIEVLP
ncbi:MAG: hypothetical protein QGH23_05170 [Dehalococcoidia bacterium]|jgi:hypothetical protein|nr:hypothetical protein [Dehalococcoidia bacterium]MDP6782892.1 hypothetical protein [Dehalococcoidia bacterium]